MAARVGTEQHPLGLERAVELVQDLWEIFGGDVEQGGIGEDAVEPVFGQCEDIDVIKRIARLAADPRTDRPYSPPNILHIKIVQGRRPVATPKATAPQPPSQ